jgi:2-methylfumaryl-CoA hydratase
VSAHSTVLGLRENSNRTGGSSGRSSASIQHGEMVLDSVRWVMVHKRDQRAAVGAPVVPETGGFGRAGGLIVPAGLKLARLRRRRGGSPLSLGGLRSGRAASTM